MKRLLFCLTITLIFFNCTNQDAALNKDDSAMRDSESMTLELDLNEANRLSQLAKNCIGTPLPYKDGHVIATPEDLDMPQVHHPAFYGCFDWHSAVHGHWSLVYLLKSYPELNDRDTIRALIDRNLSQQNLEKELAYFSMNKYTKSFERTYGWAWLLKLAEELHSWDDPQGQKWLANLEPLCDFISEQYIAYLPKLVYPIRVGEHSNTAFGLSFAYDYALSTKNDSLAESIRSNALRFYTDDHGCPIGWEPSGYDFLSPCLQEIDIMRKILSQNEFDSWLATFMPALMDGTLDLTPGEILDRTDGKLVHLDGLNFSRAWCLYPLSENNKNAYQLAERHINHSLNNITDGDYMGEHWLASFALYAYKSKIESAP
jgi:hypothetical protein